jgi:hypothetical protein
MGVYCLDPVAPGTYLHNTMDKTDIVHALNQYVENHNLYGNTIDSNTTDKQVSIFRIKDK